MFLRRMTAARDFTSAGNTAKRLKVKYTVKIEWKKLLLSELTLLKNCYQIACILVRLLLLDSRKIGFTCFSDLIIVAEDLRESLSDVLEFLLVHLRFFTMLRKILINNR